MTSSAPPAVTIPAAPSPQEVLSRLFPGVRLPPSLLAPTRAPNSGPEATAALLAALKHNHEQSHIFFNEFSFHNHSAHHLLAIYALGAPGPVITAAYESSHLGHMRAAFVAPGAVTITDDNFTDYLGNDQYYNAYLDYFHRVVLEPGATVSSILEKYVFSSHYNVRTPREGIHQPEMLNRFVEVLIHPIIHVGYGVEFGLMGLIAEGLAWTAVHPAGLTTLVTRLIFPPTRTTPLTDAERQKPEWMPEPGSRLRALNVLSLMLRDPRFGSRVLEKHECGMMLHTHGEVINEYAELWDCSIETQEDLEARLEELIWVATLMYGVGSWDGNEADYRADFFTAHIVTSVLFVPTICACLSRASQTKLLRTHFLASITWWIFRGRSGFRLKEFMSQPLPPLPNALSSKCPNTLPGTQPAAGASALPSPKSPYATNPNPWYAILANAVAHPNDHLCKAQRALAHFNILYGQREAGFVLDSLSKDGVDVNPEYRYLDGSLFLRVAWLTTGALGWVTHGQRDSTLWGYEAFHREAVAELEFLRSQGRA